MIDWSHTVQPFINPSLQGIVQLVQEEEEGNYQNDLSAEKIIRGQLHGKATGQMEESTEDLKFTNDEVNRIKIYFEIQSGLLIYTRVRK